MPPSGIDSTHGCTLIYILLLASVHIAQHLLREISVLAHFLPQTHARVPARFILAT
jgi:hypothetical protein